jgi:hypothetical protein
MDQFLYQYTNFFVGTTSTGKFLDTDRKFPSTKSRIISLSKVTDRKMKNYHKKHSLTIKTICHSLSRMN